MLELSSPITLVMMLSYLSGANVIGELSSNIAARGAKR